MYVLIGKTPLNDGMSHSWVCCTSNSKETLIKYKENLEKTLLSKYGSKVFYKINTPFIQNGNVDYSMCVVIKKFLNKNLDKGCDYISTRGINYVIIRSEEINT